MSMPVRDGQVTEKQEDRLPSVALLILIGLLAAALFSVTFVLNRAVSLSGGNWAWNAYLRYFFVVLILLAWLVLRDRHKLRQTLQLYRREWLFWNVAGGVGFGLFYACICFAADHAPAWVVAATWQTTLLATPIVLWAFGLPVPRRGIGFAILIFAGIVLINSDAASADPNGIALLSGVVPVLIAAVAYPIGNQMLNGMAGRHRGCASVLGDPFCCVLLMSIGALPMLLSIILFVGPPPPSAGQIVSAFWIALIPGVLATSLFLFARNASRDPYRIAAVDATQAGEVVFALLGELFFLNAAAPSVNGWAGLTSIVVGLAGFSLFRTRK